MDRYGQFCAVARALKVLGERWTLLVVRELMMATTKVTRSGMRDLGVQVDL
jgi:DNA-binding HxlR family transcriptional regulator